MTTIKERPILFSAPMVRAILAGRKTMTRRVVNPQPAGKQRVVEGLAHVTVGMNPADDGAVWYVGDGVSRGTEVRCPYGSFGDRLWVRETFRPIMLGLYEGGWDYRADDVSVSGVGFVPWKPSIHMPRQASRITLQVEEVRVERLQDITGADAKAEGCDPDWEAFEDATRDTEGWDEPEEFDEECEVECDWVNYGRRLVETHEHREWEIDRTTYALRLAFRNLWESINGEGSWDANPFVWCLTFSRVAD